VSDYDVMVLGGVPGGSRSRRQWPGPGFPEACVSHRPTHVSLGSPTTAMSPAGLVRLGPSFLTSSSYPTAS
jgi:hypothetical protein